MDNIVDLVRANMNQPAEPTPTENAQVLCMLDTPNAVVIYRFNSAKKGRKAYDALRAAYQTRIDFDYAPNKKAPSRLYYVEADMFDGVVDLDRVIAISFVEWPKRDKFVPRML